MLAKGLNFAVTPEEAPVVDFITATETAIRKNETFWNRSRADQTEGTPASNTTTREKKSPRIFSKR